MDQNSWNFIVIFAFVMVLLLIIFFREISYTDQGRCCNALISNAFVLLGYYEIVLLLSHCYGSKSLSLTSFPIHSSSFCSEVFCQVLIFMCIVSVSVSVHDCATIHPAYMCGSSLIKYIW